MADKNKNIATAETAVNRVEVLEKKRIALVITMAKGKARGYQVVSFILNCEVYEILEDFLPIALELHPMDVEKALSEIFLKTVFKKKAVEALVNAAAIGKIKCCILTKIKIENPYDISAATLIRGLSAGRIKPYTVQTLIDQGKLLFTAKEVLSAFEYSKKIENDISRLIFRSKVSKGLRIDVNDPLWSEVLKLALVDGRYPKQLISTLLEFDIDLEGGVDEITAIKALRGSLDINLFNSFVEERVNVHPFNLKWDDIVKTCRESGLSFYKKKVVIKTFFERSGEITFAFLRAFECHHKSDGEDFFRVLYDILKKEQKIENITPDIRSYILDKIEGKIFPENFIEIFEV